MSLCFRRVTWREESRLSRCAALLERSIVTSCRGGVLAGLGDIENNLTLLF